MSQDKIDAMMVEWFSTHTAKVKSKPKRKKTIESVSEQTVGDMPDSVSETVEKKDESENEGTEQSGEEVVAE